MTNFWLEKITIKNFKNLKQVEINLSEKLNCFIGKNGAGKTNFLDAIHYLSITKSYNSISDANAVNFENDNFFIKGTFRTEDKLNEVIVFYDKTQNKKYVKLDGKKYKRFSDHIGRFPTVMLSPFDVELILGASDIRRKFLDAFISTLDRDYLQNLMNYKKILQQRNQILKQFATKKIFEAEFLYPYNHKLAKLGHKIFEKRKKYSEILNEKLKFFYEQISEKTNEKIELQYRSHLKKDDFIKLLENSLSTDLALQYTTVGTHRDDLSFKINGKPIKKYGSNGQQRTFVIALKLAKYQIIRDNTRINPILLIDDIFDKLDKDRVNKIIQIIKNNDFGQIFITNTDTLESETFFSTNTDNKKFFVNNGVINANQ